MYVKYVKAITIVLITLVMFITIKLVSASPDKYYLEDNNILTTQSPSDPYSYITISRRIGRDPTIVKKIWYTENIGGKISGGDYYIRFWMSADSSINVDVVFKFGWYDGTKHWDIVTVSSRVSLNTSITQYTLKESGSEKDIPVGSKLYLNVTIINGNPGANADAYFYYSGATYNTHIETPTFTVPEFPIGVFLLLPMLLTLYLILRRRFLKPL